MSNVTVIYNEACPICSREVAQYQRAAEAAQVDVAFRGLDDPDNDTFGLTPDAAARRFHLVEDGDLLSGIDAFLALWRRLPRWRWLAYLVGSPGVRQIADWGYDYIAAPALYRLHRRRTRQG